MLPILRHSLLHKMKRFCRKIAHFVESNILNNIIEQNHRFIKKKVRASQCFKSFHRITY